MNKKNAIGISLMIWLYKHYRSRMTSKDFLLIETTAASDRIDAERTERMYEGEQT